MISFVFEQGTTAEIYVSMAYRALSRVEIFAEKGNALLTCTFGPRERGHMRIAEQEFDYERGSGSERTPLYVFELQDFVQSIITDREPVVGGEIGLLNIQALEELLD
jgi:predicted dehydrogenase